jgi:3-isopropylmalate/(R)-2-methylmalate dehydratase large subunit
LIGQVGAAGAVGYMVEYAGPAVRAMSIEGRMTLCNMAVEFGAWSAVVAPDEATLTWLANRPFAPSGAMWDRAAEAWRELRSDDNVVFDREIHIEVAELVPQVSWGTSPQHVAPVDGIVPSPDAIEDLVARSAAEAALRYMGLAPGQLLAEVPIDAVFIGSCTNARLGDLRAAAAILRGRRIAATIGKAIVVPGSSEVKRQAEAEGLDTIFRDAGFEWRESGCSLCFYGGGEGFPPGARVASTTNRNFENRQGPGIRTHLMSPATAAASALSGRLSDPRKVPV